MEITCNRRKFNVNENDMVMYNGKCYQIMTQLVYSGWHSYPPIIAIKKAETLIKQDKLIFHHRETRHGIDLHYYTFAKENDKCNT